MNVTKTYLPPLEEYVEYLKKIWENGSVTNNGPLVAELEAKLKAYLGIKHLFYTANGTIALQIAIKALGLTKDIITTPYSYVATTNSILWENCKPVFVDIEKSTCCIDADLIENSITENTQAILATHVYGIPCNVAKIEKIAKKNNLKVIYDAAHAFGTSYRGNSLASYGDISALSFHATKLFHTIEGGAIITSSDEIAKKVRLLRAFGHIRDDYFSIGINGRNSELHAAIGLCMLDRIGGFIEWRKSLFSVYDEYLSGLGLQKLTMPDSLNYNYSYYPVFFNSEDDLKQTKIMLEGINVFPRRYFFPSLNNLPFIEPQSRCPVSQNISSRVLCLPLANDYTKDQVTHVASSIKSFLKK